MIEFLRILQETEHTEKTVNMQKYRIIIRDNGG